MSRPHEITTRTTPISYILTCTCGWSHTEKRRQNALARAAKIEAARRKHRREHLEEGRKVVS